MPKDMNEIKVYESYWKFDLGLALSVTFIAWGVYLLLNKEDAYYYHVQHICNQIHHKMGMQAAQTDDHQRDRDSECR